jgi:hypothetical protein
MQTITHSYFKVLASRIIAGIVATLTQFACAKAEQGTTMAPLNTVSYIVWSE